MEGSVFPQCIRSRRQLKPLQPSLPGLAVTERIALADAAPDLEAIRAAQVRIAPHVHRTPVLSSRSLDQLTGSRLFFKCENLQKVGAFKARGACNAVFSLTKEDAARGVATHSSGNHGAALAYAASQRGIPA